MRPDAAHQPLFDHALARLRRARAAPRFAAEGFLHARVARELAERLDDVNRTFDRAVIVGAGGLFPPHPKIARAIHADPAAELAGRGGVAFDPDHAPFAEASLDLAILVLTLHRANDLVGALSQWRRALRPDGLLLATLFAGETLADLHDCLIAAELETSGAAALRVGPFADPADLGHLLRRAGFALPVVDVERVNTRHAQPFSVLQDLRAMAETAALRARNPPLSRAALLRAMALYQARCADPDGRVRAQFVLAHIHGWAPHESQQKPLKPGAAAVRLADALKPPQTPGKG